MGRGARTALVMGVIALTLFILLISPYNALNRMAADCDRNQARLEMALQAKFDLASRFIAELAPTVLAKDSDMSAMLKASRQATDAHSLSQRLAADKELSLTRGRIMKYLEQNGSIDPVLQELATGLDKANRKLSLAGEAYAESIEEYNVSLDEFAYSIVAGLLGFETRPVPEALGRILVR